MTTNLDNLEKILSAEQIDQYHREGYCIVPKIVPDDMLDQLRFGMRPSRS